MTLNWTKVKHSGGSVDYVTPLTEPVEWYGLVATQVLRWYNRQERSWVVSLATPEGYQVGSSEYVYSAEDAEATARFLVNGGRV